MALNHKKKDGLTIKKKRSKKNDQTINYHCTKELFYISRFNKFEGNQIKFQNSVSK